MDLLTFGEVIVFEGNHYVWLVLDQEEEKLHLARILDKEKTKELIRIDKATEKKHHFTLYDSPIFAYIVLTTDDFGGRAALLINSDGHAKSDDNFNIKGKLNNEDVATLKKLILKSTRLPARLVNLVKKLDNDNQE